MDMELTFKQLKKHKYLRMKESGGILGFDVIDENGEPPIFEGTLYCMPEILSYPFVEFDD